jgi:hypothetical protein
MRNMPENPKESARNIRLRDAIRGVADRLPEVVSVPTPASPNSWHIVAIGNIDPRQHHPQWYEQIGCMSQDEVKEAIPTLDVGQIYWSFRCAAFSVMAQGGRWEINTTIKDNRQRIIEVASKVFERLFDAYVGAVGANAMLHLETKAAEVRPLLVQKAIGMDLGLEPSNEAQMQVWYYAPNGPFVNTKTISPSPVAPSFVFYGHDRQYTPQPSDVGVDGFFNFGSILRNFAFQSWVDAELFGGTIVSKINKSLEADRAKFAQ